MSGSELGRELKNAPVTIWELSCSLPWPPSVLHPNQAPRNLAAVWSAKKRHRRACKDATDRVLRRLAVPPVPAGLIRCWVVFHPPDQRHRDVLNLAAAIKYAVDGVAEALEVNDRRMRPWVLDFGAPAPGGRIDLRLAVERLPVAACALD
jgi:crossover junction endodeoxyribonuclease RusA